jgi:FkbM family methyltransferase
MPSMNEPGDVGHQMSVLHWRYVDSSRVGEEQRRNSGWQPENLRKPEFSPATVVDVGAGSGTPTLYEAFPDAHHVLIEPLQECQETLKAWVTDHGAEFLPVAVGDSKGTVTLHVDPDAPWISSILEARWLPPRPAVDRQVEMTTLDDLLEERKWRTPLGLKIDTEGFEDRVIRGATRFLGDTQFVIAEVNVEKRFEDSYVFADFIGLMDSRDFALCDILDGSKPSPTGTVTYVDALFCRKQAQ